MPLSVKTKEHFRRRMALAGPKRGALMGGAAALAGVIMFTTSALHFVTVTDTHGGSTRILTVNQTEAAVLAQAGVAPLGENDRIVTSETPDGELMQVLRAYTVPVTADGQTQEIITTGATTRDLLTQAGLTYERRIDSANTVRMMVYAGEREIVQYQSTPAASQQAATSAGGVIDLKRTYGGMDLRWAHDTEVAARPFSLVAGLAANVVEEDRRGYNNFSNGVLGVEGALRRKERNTLTNIDPYAQVSWRFAPDWTALAGLRWSNVQLQSRDKYIANGNGDDSGSTGFHRVLPVLSLQHRVSDSANVYASVGSGFETPTFNEISYRPGSLPGLNFGLRPATSVSAEVGWKQRYGFGDAVRGEWTAAVFQTRTRNEIVVADNTGGRSSFQNAGRTRRQGLELSNTTWIDRQLQLNAAFTWLDATLSQGFCDAKGATCVPAGKRIAGTARTQAFLSLDWKPTSHWRAGIDWRHVGAVAANDVNSVRAPAYGVFGVSGAYTARFGGWKVDAFARVDNLSNKKYVGSVIVNEGNGRFYESAPGRQWMLGVTAAYQF